MGNLAANTCFAAEFTAAGGAAVLVSVTHFLAPNPRKDATLLALIALASLAQHEASELVAVKAVSATVQCLAAARSCRAQAVAEAACTTLDLLVASAVIVSDSLRVCCDLADCNAATELAATLSGSTADHVGGDLPIMLHSAKALHAALVVATRQLSCINGDSYAAREVLRQAAEGGAGSTARVMLATATSQAVECVVDSEREPADIRASKNVLSEALQGISGFLAPA